jgi:hypothetical protein
MRLPLLLILTAYAVVGQQNSLPPKEAAEGWILLFDGETTFGWTSEGGSQWSVGNGALTASGEAGYLRSNSPFADYVLRIDYRAPADENSGVFLRSAKSGQPHVTGYELQIYGKHPEYPTGSLVNHIKGTKVNPASGQWHTYEVTAQGDRFIVKLDGKSVLDGRDSKSRSGHIGLQYNKGKPIEFRNIKLKPLGGKPIFNGKDLSGWQVVDAPKAQQKPEWTVKNGAIHVEKGPGELETVGAWDDFILQMDIRTNPKDSSHHPNSGVFFRGDPKGHWSGYESQIRNEYKDNDRTQPVDWGTGAIYNRKATRKVVPNDGEYFTKTIVASGRHMAVWINGYPVTDWEDERAEGMNARNEARLKAGPIGLQAHDPTTNLDFRNIRIAALPK